MKRQTIKWDEIFANHYSNRELISIIYKEFSKPNNKKKQITQLKSEKKFWTHHQKI